MEEIDKKVVELYQEMGRGQGLDDPILMSIFARLYLEPKPIAMEKLAKKTGFSLASISNKVKMLVSTMHIKKIKKPGSKKVFLYMGKDILSIWKSAMLKKEQFVINIVKDKFPSIIKEYKEKAKTAKDKEKVKILEGYVEQINKFEILVKKILVELDRLK